MLTAKPTRALPERRDLIEHLAAAAAFLVLTVPVGLGAADAAHHRRHRRQPA